MTEAQQIHNPIAQSFTVDRKLSVKPLIEKHPHHFKNLIRAVSIAVLGLALYLPARAQASTIPDQTGNREPGIPAIEGDSFKLDPNCPPDVQINLQGVTATNYPTPGTIMVPAEYYIDQIKWAWGESDREVVQPDQMESNDETTVFHVDNTFETPGEKHPHGAFMEGDKVKFVCEAEEPVEVYNIHAWQVPETEFEIPVNENSKEFTFNVNTDLPPEILEQFGTDNIIGLVSSPAFKMNGRGGNQKSNDVASFYMNGDDEWGRSGIHGDSNPNDDSVDWFAASGGGTIFTPDSLTERTNEITFGTQKPENTFVNGEIVTNDLPPKLDVELTGTVGIWWMPNQNETPPNNEIPSNGESHTFLPVINKN